MPAEHRAVLILLCLAVGGHGARHVLGAGQVAPGAIRFLGESGNPAAHRDSVIAHARPLAAGERIDVDRAGVGELERLPGVGPGLARRILADRASKGAFGSLEGLDRVPGIGPALLTRIATAAAFSGTPRPNPAEPAPAPHSAASAASASLDLNTASETALQALPGIGPAKARAIVAYREVHGPFASVQALGKVPGVGPALVAKVAAALGLP